MTVSSFSGKRFVFSFYEMQMGQQKNCLGFKYAPLQEEERTERKLSLTKRKCVELRQLNI